MTWLRQRKKTLNVLRLHLLLPSTWYVYLCWLYFRSVSQPPACSHALPKTVFSHHTVAWIINIRSNMCDKSHLILLQIFYILLLVFELWDKNYQIIKFILKQCLSVMILQLWQNANIWRLSQLSEETDYFNLWLFLNNWKKTLSRHMSVRTFGKSFWFISLLF